MCSCDSVADRTNDKKNVLCNPQVIQTGGDVGGAGDPVIDSVRVFDVAFEPNCDLVQVFGIPEPVSPRRGSKRKQTSGN